MLCFDVLSVLRTIKLTNPRLPFVSANQRHVYCFMVGKTHRFRRLRNRHKDKMNIMLSEYSERLIGGRHDSIVVRKGVCLTLTDVSGGSNIGMVMYNAENTTERLNIPDSLKCQHTFKITKGNCLYTDMGRILCSVIADEAGWHDATSGTCTDAMLEKKPWAKTNFQQVHNDFLRSGQDSFLIELGKYGLSARDLVANMNWFSRVDADREGRLALGPPCLPGTTVTLRFEMDSLVLLHSCPHPFNDSLEYPQTEAHLRLTLAEPVAENDFCRTSCAENARGFANTERYYFGR